MQTNAAISLTRPDPRPWLEAVQDRARATPNVPWLVQPTGDGARKTYTWAQGVDEARRIAAYLGRLPAGSAVAVLSQNCAQFVLVDLAIWLAGHVSVPLYPTMLPETIRYVLDHCQARAIFVGKLPAGAPQLAAIPPELDGLACALSPPTRFARWEDVIARTAPIEGEPVRGADELAVVMYTSGTTGRPKGVELTFGAMAASTAMVGTMIEPGPADRVLSYLPMAHAAERLMVEGVSFAWGVPVDFNESLETFQADLQRTRPTLLIGVPRVWMKLRDKILAKVPEARLRRMLRTPILGRMVRKKILAQLGLDAARVVGTGAAPMPAEVIAFFSGLGLPFWELYGMTENFAYSHVCAPWQRRAGRIAPAAPGVEARIADDGELQLRSPGVMRGYHRDPEATAATFTPDGYLRTGDRGELDADGYLRITGRTKEIFKTSKGKYVAPAAIESALVATGLLELACVMGMGEPQPVAIAVIAESMRARPKEALIAEAEALRVAVNAALPPHEHLSRLVVSMEPWTTESGLLTPTLKTRRAPIEERFLVPVARSSTGTSWLAPGV